MASKFPLVFPGRQVQKRMFPYRKPTAFITLPCATALTCDGTINTVSNYFIFLRHSVKVDNKLFLSADVILSVSIKWNVMKHAHTVIKQSSTTYTPITTVRERGAPFMQNAFVYHSWYLHSHHQLCFVSIHRFCRKTVL